MAKNTASGDEKNPIGVGTDIEKNGLDDEAEGRGDGGCLSRLFCCSQLFNHSRRRNEKVVSQQPKSESESIKSKSIKSKSTESESVKSESTESTSVKPQPSPKIISKWRMCDCEGISGCLQSPWGAEKLLQFARTAEPFEATQIRFLTDCQKYKATEVGESRGLMAEKIWKNYSDPCMSGPLYPQALKILETVEPKLKSGTDDLFDEAMGEVMASQAVISAFKMFLNTPEMKKAASNRK